MVRWLSSRCFLFKSFFFFLFLPLIMFVIYLIYLFFLLLHIHYFHRVVFFFMIPRIFRPSVSSFFSVLFRLFQFFFLLSWTFLFRSTLFIFILFSLSYRRTVFYWLFFLFWTNANPSIKRKSFDIFLYHNYYHLTPQENIDYTYHHIEIKKYIYKHVYLSIYLMQELTSILTLSSLTLVNSGTLFLCLFFHLPMT